ncbi:hypothetical protein BH09VER1_BH09VER1_48760 [soil metagenome]
MGDRRSVRLELTAEGRAVHETPQRQRAEVAIAGLNASERKALVGLLGRVRGNLEEGS